MAQKGSNDLNLLLKAKVVKLQVELDTTKQGLAKARKQIDDITEKLKDKPVKLGVKLEYSLKTLQTQLKSLQTSMVNSKTIEPIKIGVQIDVQGSALNIKKQLKEVHDVVENFNKKYGKQLQDMQQAQLKAKQIADKATQTKGMNITNSADVQGFNNIKNYFKQLEQAEAQLRGKFADGKGLFSSIQFKDAEGNLRAFEASLKRVNGVVEKVKYSWNKDKNQFQVIDRTTMTQTQQMVHKAMQELVNLQRELGKTGRASKDLEAEFKSLTESGNKGLLTSDDVKAFQTKVKNAQEENNELRKTNELLIAQKKLRQEILRATKGTGTKYQNETTNLLNKTKNATDVQEIKAVRLEYDKLSHTIKEASTKEKESIAIEKQKQQALKELDRILRVTHETEGALSRDNVKAMRNMANRITSTKQLITVQKEINRMQKQETSNKDLVNREKGLLKLQKVMHDWAKITGITGSVIEKRFEQVEKNISGSMGQIEQTIDMYNKKIQKKQRQANSDILDNVAKSRVKNVDGGQISNFISNNQTDQLKDYLATQLKLNIATAKFSTDSKGITRITTQLQSTGKTAKQVTYEFNELNKQLRVVGTQDVFNRNANLGIFEQMKVALARVPVWMGAMTVFYGSINSIKAMGAEILKVDKALTDLKRVASDSINIDSVFQGSVEISKELGNSIHDIMGAVNELSRTYGEFNERQLLAVAKTATLMSNVSDLSVTEATESLVGTMNAFSILAGDSERIADSLNEVDNDFAISTKQLATGLQKSASTAKTFGVEMEENVGHITAIGAVTMESGNIIGNSLKTIYSRITTVGDAKTALNDVGVALYNIGETGQKEIKPVNDILSDLAQEWRFLSAEERQNVAVKVAGRYQLSRFLALMNNWEMSTKATKTALSSQGSAMRENAKYMESFEAKINKLKNGFTELSLAVGDSFLEGAMSLLIDLLTDLADTATKVVDTFGFLPLALGAVGMVISRMGVFKTVTNGISGVFTDFRKELVNVDHQTKSTATRMAVLSTKSRVTSASMGLLSGSVKMLGGALKGMLLSTGVGAIFVALGVAIEKVTSHLQKQRDIAEKAKKTQEQMVDSYRNTEGGLDNLIDKYEELHKQVKNDEIVEGTDAYNDYIKVTQELAEKLPTVVEYIDQSGEAHLKETDAMKAQYEIAKKLSELKAKEEVHDFSPNIDKQIDKIKTQQKEMKKLEDDLKKAEDTHGKESRYARDNKGSLQVADTYKKQIKLQTQILDGESKISDSLQKTLKIVQDTTLAHLESKGLLVNLTDAGQAVIENMVQANDSILRDALESNDMELFKKRTDELLDSSKQLGEFMSDQYTSATAGVDDPFKIKEIKGNMDVLFNSLPTTFFKDEAFNNIDKLEESFEGIIAVSEKVKDGKGNFNELVKELEGQNMETEEAQTLVAGLANQYQNATIKSQYMTEMTEEQVAGLQEYNEKVIESIDLTEQLFNYNDEDISAMKSHFDKLNGYIAMYGKKNAETSEEYKDSLSQISAFLEIPEETINKNIGYYTNVLDLLSKAELQYDENTNALIGFNKENLNDKQVEILNKAITLGKEHGIRYDILTQKMYRFSDGEEVVWNKTKQVYEAVKDTNDEIAKKPEKNGQKETLDETKTSADKATESVLLLKNANLVEQETGENPLKEDLDGVSSAVDKVMQKGYELKQQQLMNPDDPSIPATKGKISDTEKSLVDLDNKSNQLKNKGFLNPNDPTLPATKGKINDTEKSLVDLDNQVNIMKGKNMLNTGDTSPETTQGKVKGVTKSVEDLQKKAYELKQQKLLDFENEAGTTNTKTKVDELTTAIQKATTGTKLLSELNSMVGDSAGKVNGLLDKLKNIATAMGDVSAKANGLTTVKNAVVDMANSLIVVQDRIGGIFNGLGSVVNSLQAPIGAINNTIGNVQLKVEALRGALTSLSSISTGSLTEYVGQLGLLSHNLVLASQYGHSTASAQSRLVSAFANVVTVTKAYNSAITNAGSSMGKTYKNLAQTIVNATSIMVNQYIRNMTTIKTMVATVERALGEMTKDFRSASNKSASEVESMVKKMHKEFKSGMDDIVDTASDLPQRIATSIRDNMGYATGAMDDVAKNMVKRFKEELGIHSPSKVFENLGMWTIKGLANGLSDGDLVSLGKNVFSEFGGEAMSSIDSIKDYMQFGAGDIGIGASFGNYTQTSGFGMRVNPTTGEYKLHKGTDFAGANNSPIQAKAGGKVIASGWNSGGYGNYVKVQNGQYTYLYAHLNKAIPPVGSTVKAGQLIGLMGSTGDSTGTHLHYEVHKNGRPINPRGYAKGGFIDKEQIAKIGEHGKKEVVIPLEQHRSRAMDLWSKAGNYLGVDPKLLEIFKQQLSRGKGGQSLGNNGGGSFSASSGEGGGESGGGDSGTSGILQTSKYDGLRTVDGDYEFISLASAYENRPDAVKYDYEERSINSYDSQISVKEAQMNRLTKSTLSYRNALKSVVALQQKQLVVQKKDLAQTEARQKQIKKELAKLPSVGKQTTKQRETYNSLMQQYDTNLGKIEGLRTSIESNMTAIRDKSTEIFLDFVEEIVTKYDSAITTIKDKIDNTEFKIEVMTLTNPNDKKGLLNAQIDKATQQQQKQVATKNKMDKLQSEYNKVAKSKGGGSAEAKAVKEKLLSAQEEYEDVQLELLQAEKEIRDTRQDIADTAIDSLKDYYGTAKDMALKAIDIERKALEKAHDDKMKLYDKELEKINSVYDEKIKQMDKEKSEDDYQEELDSKNVKKSDLMNKINILSRDTTLDGRNKVAELKKELDAINKEIKDFQEERQDEVLRNSLEEQKNAQIKAIETDKETETKNHEADMTELDTLEVKVTKQYDDLINNDKYWADRRNEAIKGNFNTISSELTKMTTNLNNMNKGVFTGLLKELSGFSSGVQKELNNTYGLDVDNLINNTKDPIGDVNEAKGAKKYTETNGKVKVKVTAPKVSPVTSSPVVKKPAVVKKPTTPAKKPATKKPATKAPAKKPATTTTNRKTTSAVYFRKAPAYGNNIQLTIPKGAKVEYVGMEKGWAKIKYNKKTGYVGSQFLQKFDTGGYTGNNVPKSGALAVLHNKELVLNERQTSDILDTAKIMKAISQFIPNIKKASMQDKLSTAESVTNISIGDINVTVENGDKKKAKEIASESASSFMKELKKRGKR